MGAQGTQGTQGAVGAQGTQGTQGAVGAQGTQGAQGAVGAQGTQGAQGAVGAQGTQGAQGAQGAEGAQGTQGATGGATYVVGQSGVEGGTVFWVDSSGQNGLVALTILGATGAASTYAANGATSTLSGAQSWGVYGGVANTVVLNSTNAATGTATYQGSISYLTALYGATFDGTLCTYNVGTPSPEMKALPPPAIVGQCLWDWYIPSAYEAALMCNSNVLDGINIFWTSTETSPTAAYAFYCGVDCSSGLQIVSGPATNTQSCTLYPDELKSIAHPTYLIRRY